MLVVMKEAGHGGTAIESMIFKETHGEHRATPAVVMGGGPRVVATRLPTKRKSHQGRKGNKRRGHRHVGHNNLPLELFALECRRKSQSRTALAHPLNRMT